MPGCRVAFAIVRAGTGLDDAVPQRYNLSMCAFKVLSSCPRDVSYRRQAAEHDILMRKWETPLPCGLPSTGFLPLAGLLERHFLRAHHPHTDADPASHRVCLWRGGSASKVLLLRVFFPRVRLHGHPEVCNCPWLLLWSRGGRRDCAAGGHRSFCDPVCSQSAPCILIFSPKRCL